MKSTKSRARWATITVVVSAVAGVALAAAGGDTVTELHGAMPMTAQQAQLDTLGLSADFAKPPRGVDAGLWLTLVPQDNAPTAQRVALGRALYFETALSKDGTVSCATCHDVSRSFTDRRAVSEGVGGQNGKRNAPPTMNAAMLGHQFLDGRSATLEAQAGQPILNPVEMAMPDREAALAKLRQLPQYEPMFREAYGRGINYDDLQRAIAAFERTLMFLDAPFDRFLGGDEKAISAAAARGWDLFNGTARCVSCHPINETHPLGMDNRFHNIGVAARHQNFEKLAKEALTLLGKDASERKLDELAVGTDLSELGRFMVTKNYADIGAFRTLQLRNIGITAPYMHDGSMETLWDTIDHYNKGGEPNRFLDGGIEALALTEADIDDLVAFLFTLTDERFAALNREEQTRQQALATKARPFRDDAMAQRKVLAFEQRVVQSQGGAQ